MCAGFGVNVKQAEAATEASAESRQGDREVFSVCGNICEPSECLHCFVTTHLAAKRSFISTLGWNGGFQSGTAKALSGVCSTVYDHL